MKHLPHFSGALRKNDALFMYGALQPKPFIFVYEQRRIEVVHGPSCQPQKEINLDRCLNDDVAIEERRGGGGTVVLGPGMIITIIVGERSGILPATVYFNRIHDAMIALFDDVGISGVTRNGVSDLAIKNRKILGSSLYLGTRPRYYYYQSSLLVAPDFSLFERYLCHPSREPDYRMHRSHCDFCTSLVAEGFSVTAATLGEVFFSRLSGYL